MKKERVLIVGGDDETTELLIASTMKKKGFFADTISDADEAWKEISNKNYSLIFLNGRHSQSDGFEIIEKIKKSNANLPIIVLAEPHALKYAVQTIKAGACNYLVKPFAEEEIHIIADKAIAIKNFHTEFTFLKSRFQEKGLTEYAADNLPKTLAKKEISLEKALDLKLKNFFDKMEGVKLEGLHQMVLQTVEKLLITLTLDKTHGNQAKASKILGINRNTLRKKIISLKISIER